MKKFRSQKWPGNLVPLRLAQLSRPTPNFIIYNIPYAISFLKNIFSLKSDQSLQSCLSSWLRVEDRQFKHLRMPKQ